MRAPRLICLAILFCATALPVPVFSQDTGGAPKVGVVLSGGGARGAAHVGVLRVLEDLHIPIYCIVGTSMGSIVGGLYSSGVTLDEVEQVAVNTDWAGIFSDKISRQKVNFRDKTTWPNYITSLDFNFKEGITLPGGLIKGKRLDLMLRSLTLNASRDFDQFPIPFRAIASNIETGEMVVLSQGDLARSLRASMAVPGVFAPVEIDGKLLVDGGVTQNLAVEAAKNMGADVVIAVNIGTPLSTRDEIESFLGVVGQLSNILTNRNVAEQISILGPQDTLIAPELGAVTTASFDKMDEAIEIGANAARGAREDLIRYSVGEDEYQAIRDQQLMKARTVKKIEFVKVDQQSVVGSGIIMKMITKSAQNILKKDVLAYDIFELYKQGNFEDIDFTIVEEDGKQGILINAKKQNKAVNTLEVGMEAAGTVQKDNSFLLVARHTASMLNSLGAQWRNEIWIGQYTLLSSEFYQPLSPYTWHMFLEPRAEYFSYPVDLYVDYTDDHATARYSVKRLNAGLDIGLQMGEYGEARFGYMNGKAEYSLDTGSSLLPDSKNDDGAMRASLVFDRLDSPFFPRHGSFLSAQYLYGRERLGSDYDYGLLRTSIVKPFSFGMHTILFRGMWETNFDSTEALDKGFFLGGLFKLSGFNMNQLYGRHVGLAEMIYFARIAKLPTLLGSDLYAGASFEAGNAWMRSSEISTSDTIYAGSLFVSMDTRIGPIYLGYGHAESNSNAVYFSIGAKIF
jgi:NTE family protein